MKSKGGAVSKFNEGGRGNISEVEGRKNRVGKTRVKVFSLERVGGEPTSSSTAERYRPAEGERRCL